VFVHWQSRECGRSSLGGNDCNVRWAATVAENMRVNSEPVQRHLAKLISFTEDQIKHPAQRCLIWDHVTERLDKLGNRINTADREMIEAAVAAKVPRPTPEEYKATARDFIQTFGWKWATYRQRAVLHDEVEQLQEATAILQRSCAQQPPECDR